jgi:hypothetical protein
MSGFYHPISGSSVGEPTAGRRDTVVLVTSPIRSEAWIAQGKCNRDERVAPFIEHEFDPADVAAKELIRGWSILLVCKLDATGRTRPRHDRVHAVRSRRVRWRYSNEPQVRHAKRSQRSTGSSLLSAVVR